MKMKENLNCKLQVTLSKLSIDIGTLRGNIAEFPSKEHPVSLLFVGIGEINRIVILQLFINLVKLVELMRGSVSTYQNSFYSPWDVFDRM